jgi:UDP-N-acetylmuramate--alanine ligase
LVLLPIYPAREEPIPGVTSEILGGKVVAKNELTAYLQAQIQKAGKPVVVATLGAGDIDRLVPDITANINHKS